MAYSYLNELCAVQAQTLEKGVLIHTGADTKIRLDVCFDDCIRVWADPKGTFVKDPSYAIENEDLPAVPFRLEDKGDYFFVGAQGVAVRVYKSPLRLAFYTPDDQTLISREYKKGGMGFDEKGGLCMYQEMGADEHFYGLGEDNDAFQGNLDRRGSSRDMITGQTITSGCVTADIPVTFFMSTGNEAGGYGIFVDNTYRMKFDMGKKSDEYYYFTSLGGELLFYFFYGPRFEKILDRYTQLTGRPSFFPLWTLGFIQSKCTYYDWQEMEDVIQNLKKNDIPLDCMVYDGDWAEDWHNFKWHPRWKGMCPEKTAQYRKEGIEFMASNAGPMIKKDSSNFQSGMDAGVFAKDTNGNTVTCGHYGGELLDFSNPDIKDWLKPQMQHLYDEGIRGYWLDLTEPEGDPDNTVYHDGPKAKVHNVFSLLMSKTYDQILKEFDPNTRRFILTRTGTAGVQKYATAIWTGDIYSNYDTFKAHCPEALNTTMSGIPGWTCDSGGFISATYDNSLADFMHLYNNDPHAQALLYERWLQLSCFSPITRAHHVGPSAPYMFGPLVAESCRHYLKLRYRLIPYIYTYNYHTHLTGAPLMRPLVFDFQDDPKVVNLKYQYMFGKELMVCPVVDENCTAVHVYFPEGTWYDYDYGCIYEGGKEYVVYAPQNRIPVFVRMNSIIPMAPQMNHTSEKPWDPITFDIYPLEGQTASFTLFQDDGKTYDFEKGAFTETAVSCDYTAEDALRIRIEQSNKLFTPKTYVCQIRVLREPVSFTVNGRALENCPTMYLFDQAQEGYFFDKFARTLYLKFHTNDGLIYEADVALDMSKKYYFSQPAKIRLHADDEPQEAAQASAQIPYLYPAASIPCKVQAHLFDRGGEGVAYHVSVPGNEEELFRPDKVALEPTDDEAGNYCLSDIQNLDWFEYSVNVEEEGYYDLDFRVMPVEDGGCFMLETDGKNISGVCYVPVTAEKGTWTTLTVGDVLLDSGPQTLKFFAKIGGFKLNYIGIRKK